MTRDGLDANRDARSGDERSRYQPALDYIELDRAHRKRSSWRAVLTVSVIVLVVSLAMLGVIAYSYLQGQMKNSQLAENADLSGIETSFSPDNFNIDWEALRAVNPDTVAWVYVPGTAINYPVVQGKDNDYYLSHDFNGDQGWLAQFGAIFLDWRNNPNWSDQAYFLYGHHMNDGSMFADIARMSDQARFDASRTVYLLSPKGSFKLRAFSLIHCASDDPLVQISFETPDEMIAYIQDKVNRSVVSVGDIPKADEIDQIFAFATCDNYSAGRYVLYAYVEKDLGRIANVATNAAVNEGGAQGRIDDLADRKSESRGREDESKDVSVDVSEDESIEEGETTTESEERV